MAKKGITVDEVAGLLKLTRQAIRQMKQCHSVKDNEAEMLDRVMAEAIRQMISKKLLR
jgi:hypothetical protein